jgi:hypothetical protein
MKLARSIPGAVIVRLLGGLGNQMFQYALGRALSIRYGAPLKLDLSVLHRGRHAVKRNYDLDIFQLDAEFATRSDVSPYHPFGAGLVGKIWFHMRDRLVGTNAINEQGFRFDPCVLKLKPPLYLAGLWQSYRYFADAESELRDDFRFRADVPASAASIAAAIADPDSVCVHVRRGDYVTASSNAQSLGFVGLDYYRRGVEIVRSAIPHPRFFVFSDDLAWCEQNLDFLDRAVFVRYYVPPGRRAHACDMQLMARAHNFILANSTFSWWSAWLSGPRTGMTIAPKQWFKDGKPCSADLIPPGWIEA